MPETHFDGKVALKAVITSGEKVLVLRDPREEREIWELPGGRLNKEELIEEGLAREVKEELGIDIAVGEVLYMTQFFQHSEQRNALVIVFIATMQNPDQEIMLEPGEVSEIRWVNEDEAEKLEFFPEYKTAIMKYFVTLCKL